MSLHQIEFFLSVARHLNFTKAAQECNISQSAISQQIENFENTLGFKLFNRNNRKTTLTKGGEVFLTHAQQILDAYNKAVLESSLAASSLENRIRIGYSGPWEKSILPRIACAYNQIAPDISLQFQPKFPISVTMKITKSVENQCFSTLFH